MHAPQCYKSWTSSASTPCLFYVEYHVMSRTWSWFHLEHYSRDHIWISLVSIAGMGLTVLHPIGGEKDLKLEWVANQSSSSSSSSSASDCHHRPQKSSWSLISRHITLQSYRSARIEWRSSQDMDKPQIESLLAERFPSAGCPRYQNYDIRV